MSPEIQATTTPAAQPTTGMNDTGTTKCTFACPPGMAITVDSPENTTYNQDRVWANVTLNEDADWCGYSLDGNENQTMDTDAPKHWYYDISSLSNEQHSIKFYCNNSRGEVTDSSTVYFTISAVTDCNCSNCSDCMDKLNDPACSIVYLTENITNHSGTCINNPANFSNKVFDCQRNIIDGNDSGDGIFFSNRDITIRNCVITDFNYGIYAYGCTHCTYSPNVSNINIFNNAIENNTIGIYVYGESYYSIIGNPQGWKTYMNEYKIKNNILRFNTNEGIKFYLQGEGSGYVSSYTYGYRQNISDNSIRDNGGFGVSITSEATMFGKGQAYAAHSVISNNNISGNGGGISFSTARLWDDCAARIYNNTIKSNTITNNSGHGIDLVSSTNNNITDNDRTNNEEYSLFDDGREHYRPIGAPGGYSEIGCNYAENNTGGDGKPIRYERDTAHITIANTDEYSEIIFCNVTESEINNVIVSNPVTMSDGILLVYSDNNTIRNSNLSRNFRGIHLWLSEYNNLTSNTANNNSDAGILLFDSIKNTLTDNTANNNPNSGIRLDRGYPYRFQYNSLANNTATGNSYGIYVNGEYSSTLTDNTATGNSYGIYVNGEYSTLTDNTANDNILCGIYMSSSCDHSTIANNTANNNDYGIYLSHAEYNNLTSNTANNNIQNGIILNNADYNNLTSNTACNTTIWEDIARVGGTGNTGDNNTCNTTWNWNDDGIENACTFRCDGTACDFDDDYYVKSICIGNDCNDSDASINPEATEICNGVDDNCDGEIDEGCEPDLIVTNITYTPENPMVNDEVLINATIANTGNVNASGLDEVNVSLFIDDSYENSKILNLTNVNEKEVNFTWIAEGGLHNITIEVDPLDEIDELNESNNAVDTEINVTSPLTDCNCSNCSDCMDKLNDTACSVVTLNANITNHSGTCIDDPENFSNKVFDCQGYMIDGDDNHTINSGDSEICAVVTYSSKDPNAWYIWNNSVSKGEVVCGELNDDYSDYTTPWCTGWGCCDSSEYNRISLSRIRVSDDMYVIQGTGGISGGSWWYDVDINVSDEWKIISLEGSIGRTSEGAYYQIAPDGKSIHIHGGLSYNGCGCSNCGRNNYSITVVRADQWYGVYLNGKENNTVRNCAITDFTEGIRLSSSNDNILTNNTANLNYYGISLVDSTNNTLTNNTANLNSQDGIYLQSSQNYDNVIVNNTANSNSFYGIHLGTISGDNIIISNTFCNNTYDDIYNQNTTNAGDNNTCDTTSNWNDTGTTGCTYTCTTESDNICYCSNCDDCEERLSDSNCDEVLLDTNISNHPGTCINFPANNKVFDCQDHTINGTGTGYGIYLDGKINNAIKNCVVTNFVYGIYLDSSSNDTILTNNNVSSNIWHGIFLWRSSNNTLTNNILSSNGKHGIFLSSSSNNNTLTSNTGNLNNWSGIWSYSSSNNAINSNNFCNNNQAGDSFDDIVVAIGSNSGDNNTCDTVSGWNDDGTSECTYHCDGTCGCGGTGNPATDCDDCEERLSDSKCTVVQLEGDIIDQSGTCINSPANFNNKTFDCQGHLIDGDGTGNDYGISLNDRSNNIIRNCDIREFSGIWGSNWGHGKIIHLTRVNNITVINNIIHDGNNAIGIGMTGSHNCSIIGNTIYNMGSTDGHTYNGIEIDGLWTSTSTSNLISGNNITSNGRGIWLRGSSNNILKNNIVNSNDYGIVLSDSSNDELSENIVCNNTNMDIDNGGTENTGDNNTCDTTWNWNDDGIENGCTFRCDGTACDFDNDYYVKSICVGNDCNDNNASINPDATEICNGVDDDCDGLTDAEDPDLTPCTDDGVGCTDDVCQAGACQHIVNDSNCPADAWTDTGNTRWVDDSPCTEREQKEQEFRDYYCHATLGCQYTVTGTQWVDTGATRNKQDGTVCTDDGVGCTDDVCQAGACQHIVNDSNCPAAGTCVGTTGYVWAGICDLIGGCTTEPAPEEVCDNIDNDCDGEIDEGGVCPRFYAAQDIPISNNGGIINNYTYTKDSDNQSADITERESGGKPSDRYTYLEHKWTIDVTGGYASYVFHIEAHHTANLEGDDFVFAYSTDNIIYHDMVTVTKTTDDDTYQTFTFPDTISGTVYIRVKDLDQTPTHIYKDTIYIDHMYIEACGELSNEPPYKPSNPDPANGAANVTLNPALSVYVSDPDGDTMDVSFYDEFDTLIGTNAGVSSGSRAFVVWSGLEASTTYGWYAVADDNKGVTNTSDTW